MKKFFPGVVFFAVAIAAAAVALFAYFAAQEAARIKFDATADEALNRIQSRVDLHMSLLRSTQALFKVEQGTVNPSEFKSFFDALNVSDNFEGLRGIGFVRLIEKGQEGAVESELAQHGDGQKEVYPETDLTLRAPIVLFEPRDQDNSSGMGYDMMTDPIRRPAIESAISTGEPRATGRVMLGEATGSSQTYPGFLIFLTVTPEVEPTSTTAGGLLYIVFRSADLFHATLGRAPLLPVQVEIFDTAVGDQNLLYRSAAPLSEAYGGSLLAMREIVVAGRRWSVIFRPSAEFAPPSSRIMPFALGLFGLLLAGAVALVARYQQRAFEAISALHETTESSLAEKDLMLQEMKHRIKNSIARVLAMSRQTAAHSKDMNEFATSFSARLQAMSNSQDMLTRSYGQKADMEELLRMELGQVFGGELPADAMDGPKIMLNETATQAMGLTFHELATNAIKYGRANKEGTLRVSWLVKNEVKNKVLTLRWEELGSGKINPPEKTGFGTKLIDMNIVRELRGTIERAFGDDGIVITITIPLNE
ncbi:CHASE domain-containing protein [Mesorhizobium sp. SB112]|uniref:CHASE domain-containing protein n=1 Tax=Mesorhizobium sp. SB112 TaxID=3151853 RepID=UPI003264E36A